MSCFSVTIVVTISINVLFVAVCAHSDRDMDEKQYKMWKKSIILVWRSIANHKYVPVCDVTSAVIWLIKQYCMFTMF